jgi:DNA-binding SARP family transcriptional activator
MLAAVDVAVLGPLTVSDGATTIDIRAAKERAVVAALALAVPRPLRAETLIDALWGERPPATASKTLQNYVARLRRILPPGTIVSEAGGYRLCVEPEDVDAHRVERAVAAGRAARQAGDALAARRHFEAALSSWRGETTPDLADDHAIRFAELARSAEDDLADARLALGDDEVLVAELDAAARAEPLRERRWAQLMLALFRAGRQAEALRAYHRARRALVDGLGLEPGAELRELQRRVIAQDPTLLLGHADATVRRANFPAALTAVSTATMVGRADELDRLAGAWAAARAGLTRVAVISGEPGIGKSRLLAEVARSAHRDGALVLFGRCDAEPVTPYQPVVEGLRWYVGATPAGALRAGLGWEARELARLVPELARRVGRDVPPAAADGAGRHRLFEAVAAFLDGRATERPVVLALDDLHWADPGTRLLLRHVLRTLPESRLLVVATHRTHDDRAASLAALLEELPIEVAPLHIALGGLTVADIAALIGPTAAGVAGAVQRAAGGSPLFVAEITDHVRATGRIPTPTELPGGLHQAVGRRLAGVDASTRSLIEVGAVIGTSFDVTTAGVAAGFDAEEAARAGDAAVRAGVFRDDPDGAGRVSFAHDVVRAVVDEELAPGRRRTLHRRIAEALAADSDTDPAVLARHYLAAAGGRRDAAAAEWSARAGRAALDQLAWEMAAAHFGAAADATPDRGSRAHVEVLVDLGRALRASGSSGAAKERFREAIELSIAAGQPAWRSAAALAWADVPVDVRRELSEVVDVLRGAAAADVDAPPERRARLLGRLAFSLGWQHAPDARVTADEAIDLARRSADALTLARVLSWSSSTRPPFETGAENGPSAELAALAAGLRDPSLAFVAAAGDAVRHVQHARRSEAIAALAAARAIADEQRLVDLDVRATKLEADWALVDGRLADAERAVATLFDVAARHETRNTALFAGALLYDVRRWQGQLSELAPWFDRLAASGERVALVPAMHVEVLIAAGRWNEVRTRLDDYVATDFADVWPVEEAHSFATLAACAAAVGHRNAIAALAERLAPWSGLVVWDGDGGILGAVDHYLGLLAAAAGDRTRAGARFAAARRTHNALGSPSLVAMTEVAASR